MNWSERPFVRIFLFFATGIFLAFNFEQFREASSFVYIGLIVTLLLISLYLLKKRLSYTWHWVQGVVLGLSLIITGVLIMTIHLPRKIDDQSALRGTFAGVISSYPVETGRTFKVVVQLKQKMDSSVIPLSQKVLLYIEKDSSYRLKYGDVLLFTSILKPPDAPTNPDEFNYKNFLKTKGLEQVGFVRARQYQVVGYDPPNTLISWAISLRQKILGALKDNGLEGEEYAVAAAIVLGYDDVMDDGIRQNYQRAGAMHVLCVSGLHVGIIYLIFELLLKFLNKNRRLKIVKVVILLLAVWMYALITGLAPSVMRATVMISFIIIGNEVERDKDAYNTLAMSAMFLLLYNPRFLFEVGFQLSYAAVLGIVTFYWPFYRVIYIKNAFLNKLWSATAISLAAQMGTFPLAVHYFHFFPTWFLLSNIVILIFSAPIIATGMLFIVVSWIPVISGWIALVLSGFIYLMNYLIALIGHLPASGVTDLYFPFIIVVTIYLILFAVYRLIIKHEHGYIIPFLGFVLFLILIQVAHKFEVLNQKYVMVYDVGRKHEAIDFVLGGNHLLLCDSSLLKEPKTMDFVTDNHRIRLGLKKSESFIEKNVEFPNIGLWSNGLLFSFNGISIAKVTGSNFYPLNVPLEVNWVWITGSGRIDMEKLLRTFSFQRLIIGQSVYPTNAKKITEELAKLNIPVYNINKDGAYIYKY